MFFDDGTLLYRSLVLIESKFIVESLISKTFTKEDVRSRHKYATIILCQCCSEYYWTKSFDLPHIATKIIREGTWTSLNWHIKKTLIEAIKSDHVEKDPLYPFKTTDPNLLKRYWREPLASNNVKRFSPWNRKRNPGKRQKKTRQEYFRVFLARVQRPPRNYFRDIIFSRFQNTEI